ncbi:hypothetical protein [Nonomuraea soli]|uniref:Putative DNA-binding protein n=1 Tax=Nonomuraea soli TaxID=1032476 RepID=A0A7W0CSC5_9ACTN|nr:hypothetical protein [Nonomuraea soli]MBA2896419.1 putative DNA-binding protein [Nonomuraea soli]
MPPPRKRTPDQADPTELHPLEPQEPAQSAEPPTGRARRTKQPVWTERISTGFRLTEEAEDRLTLANERTGLGPQQLVEAAINRSCDELGIPEQMPPGSDLKMPRHLPARTGEPGRQDRPLISIRLSRNTRARLVAAVDREQRYAYDVIEDMLTDYLDKLNAPPAQE